MRFFNLKITFFLIFLSVPFLCFGGVVPDRHLNISSPELPIWKERWDSGRHYVKNGNFKEAAKLYHSVLEQRPEIDLVKWEYCQVLYYLGNSPLSAQLLSELLDNTPEKQDILLFAAKVAFAEEHYNKSSKYYRKVYENSPYSDIGLDALKGLVVSLLQEKKGKEALPLMRQLTVRTKNNMAIIKELALLTSSLGLLQESQNYYQELLKKNLISGEDALEASQAFENEEEYSDLDRILKEEYLASFSGDLLVREKLGESYLQAGLQEKAVVHLEILAESGDPVYWLKAARIYENSMERPDKALYCYEQYLQIYPNNNFVSDRIDSLRTEMAEELLVLVQNVKPQKLWKDIDQLIDAPEDIYLKMVEKAQAAGNKTLALQLVDIISEKSTTFDKLQIAEIYNELGAYEKSLRALMQVEQPAQGLEYYKKRAQLERKLNYSVKEYKSQLEVFFLKPNTNENIPYFIDVIGKFGFIDDLDRLLSKKKIKEAISRNVHLAKKIIAIYIKTGRYNSAYDILKGMKNQGVIDKKQYTLMKAEILSDRGFTFEAEQIYRELLTSDTMREAEIISKIVTLYLENHNLNNAKLWYEQFVEKRDRYQLDSTDKSILSTTQAKIFCEEKSYAMAEFLLKTKLKKERENFDINNPLFIDLISILAESLFKQNKYEECFNLLEKYNIKAAIYYLSKKDVKGSELKLENYLQVINYHLKHDNVVDAQLLIDTYIKKFPESLLAQKYYAEFLKKTGAYSQSLAIYHDKLQTTDKQESYYLSKTVDLYANTEQNNKELALLLNHGRSHSNIDQIPYENEIHLKTCRALWRAGNKQESLALYLKIIDNLGQNLELIAAIENNELQSKGYWSEITSIFYPEKPVREKVMSPGFLLTFHEKEETEVINSLYSHYRWHRLFSREYQARNASYQKKLFLAEKNYRKLFSEEGSSEAMMDLAIIYKRLGHYGKEAEVYNRVKKTGVAAPELDESIKENEQQRKPQVALEANFSNKDGRDGAIDMMKFQLGSSFWYMPDLKTDLFVKYLRTTYEDDLFDKESNFIGIGGKYNFNDNTKFFFNFGGEDLSGDSDIKIIAGAKVEHRLSDNFRSYWLFDQRRVDDTIESVEEQIMSQDLEAGLVLETELGLEVGADYRYSFLTGDNEMDRLHGWLFYNIFGDKTRLDFHYDFEYIYGDDSSTGLSYWSPQDYRVHELSLYFKHQFASIESDNEVNSYYSFEYSIGFEDDQNILYTGEFDIFLEMSDNYLLKGSVLYSRSDDYDESGVKLLFVYRW